MLARIERLIETPITSTKYIADGLSNDNFIINNRSLIKIKDKLRQPFNNFTAEMMASDMMASKGLAPRILNASDDGKIIHFQLLNNVTYLSSPPTNDEFALVANLINTLHKIKIKVPLTFDLRAMITHYKAATGPQFADAKYEVQIIAAYEAVLDRDRYVLSHNDIVRGNLLFQKDKAYLIDYEYAAMNDPLFDHLSFLGENDIDDPILIADYLRIAGINPEPRKVFAMQMGADLLWFYWAHYMFKITNKDIFLAIAGTKLQRIKKRSA